MAVQASTTLRNAWLAVTGTTIGPSPVIKIRSGSKPANCAAADNGTVLATIVLPSDWLSAPSGGTASKVGSWIDAAADASGTAMHFRVYDADGDCHLQGTVTATGDGGDMTMPSTTMVEGVPFTIDSFVLTGSGA